MQEAILFISKGEILTITYDVLLMMFYMHLPYFQEKERYLGFVESFANLGCSLALHFWVGWGGVGCAGGVRRVIHYLTTIVLVLF